MAALIGLRGQPYSDRLYDASGAIASGSAPQLIVPVANIRTSFYFENTSGANMLLEVGPARAGLATLSSGTVASVSMSGTNANVGFGYSRPPLVTFLGGALGNRSNPSSTPAYTLQGTADFISPSNPAQAHCVMTGAAGSMTVSSIFIDNPGSGYAYPPLVLLTNDPLDPFGAAAPSATIGMVIVPEGSFQMNGSICTTDQISVFCATSTSTYVFKYTN